MLSETSASITVDDNQRFKYYEKNRCSFSIQCLYCFERMLVPHVRELLAVGS